MPRGLPDTLSASSSALHHSDLARTSKRLAIAAAVVCLAADGCGGSPTSPVPPPPADIQFTPSGAGSNSLSLLQVDATATTLTLSLDSDTVDGLYAIAFDLAFPSALLDLVSITEGNFLSGDGSETTFQFLESADGVLVVGLSLLGPLPGAVGSGTLLTLEFSRIDAGLGAFVFDSSQAFGSGGEERNDIAWAGGTVQVP